MKNELISVIDVAKTLGKHKAYIFKVLSRLGIETRKEKNSNSRGQKIAYITSDELSRVKEHLAEIVNDSEPSTIQADIGGLFYLIQLEPSHDSGRFKLGFTINIEERLRSHKTAAPFSEIIKTWPCKQLWEKTVIDCVSYGCERLHTEVFRAESIDEVRLRCAQFFKMMPDISPRE